MSKAGVVSKHVFKQIRKKVDEGAKGAFDTVATDIRNTSSGASPIKTGHLEKNHLNINYGRSSWTATIFFVAFNQGFDYANWTHEASYNLGPRSRQKPPAKSKFAGTLPVGNQYATRTVEQGREAYQEHIAQSIIDGLGD